MDIRLPRLGEGADSGTVVSVFVKEGDQVKKDQTLIELENEKAVAAIPSTASGTVTKVHVRPGDKIAVGQPIVSLAGDDAGSEKAPTEESPRVAAAPPPAQPPKEAPPEGAGAPEIPVRPGIPPPASPYIRKIARELEIDLRLVKGSEHGGRIVLADLEAYVRRLKQTTAQPRTSSLQPPASSLESIDFAKWGPVTKRPMSSLRRTIAQRMSASWTAIPHVTQFDEADITALLELKTRYDAAYERRGAKLTLTAFLLKASAATLKAHPKLNVSLDEAAQEIVEKHYCHIGVAVDTEAGLLVPVLRDVDKKPLAQVSKELNELAEKTRQRKVTVEELQGGTFTISNQGGIGGGHFTPIIRRPEVAILGVGRGMPKPVVRQGRVEPRTMLPLALSYDHRVIDGADAARFIVDLVNAIAEYPEADVKI